jgi:hypothetical protein
MGMEVIGKLHAAFETKQVSERFQKREFVVELGDNPKYPQFVLFQLTGDRCGQLDAFEIGDPVRVEFSLRGREWRSAQGEVKYFNSLDVWSLEPSGARAGRGAASVAASGGGRGGRPVARGDEPPPPSDRDLDDLPF